MWQKHSIIPSRSLNVFQNAVSKIWAERSSPLQRGDRRISQFSWRKFHPKLAETRHPDSNWSFWIRPCWEIRHLILLWISVEEILSLFNVYHIFGVAFHGCHSESGSVVSSMCGSRALYELLWVPQGSYLVSIPSPTPIFSDLFGLRSLTNLLRYEGSSSVKQNSLIEVMLLENIPL